MNITAYIARAFCHNSLGGNLAGVVILDEHSHLTPEQMQYVAKKLNFSETAFIIPKEESHSYKALYYTPTSSIDFCGHATLAAFGVLNFLGSLKNPLCSLDTPAGQCHITLKEQKIFMSQLLPKFEETINESEINAIFGKAVCSSTLAPRIVSTGLRDIFVCVHDVQCLQALQPDLAKLMVLNKKTDSIGMHLFSLDPSGGKITAHCRNFAPLYGINEESATGSSNGALACYLFESGLLPSSSSHNLLFRQGESLNAPSDIYVQLKTNGIIIEKVECGGEVILDQKKIIDLAEIDEN